HQQSGSLGSSSREGRGRRPPVSEGQAARRDGGPSARGPQRGQRRQRRGTGKRSVQEVVLSSGTALCAGHEPALLSDAGSNPAGLQKSLATSRLRWKVVAQASVPPRVEPVGS